MGQSIPDSQTTNMLVFLSLLSTALAAPQLYPTYGTYGYPGYYPMSVYPGSAYPVYPRVLPGYYPQVVGSVGSPATRTGVVKFGNFLEINGVFEQVATATTTVPMTIVKGNFNIQQNGILDIFSGADAKITAYIMSSTDLAGKNVKLHIGTGADCVAAFAAGPTEVAMVNAPPSINGFYINGRTEGFNIDGMNGKTSLMGANKWLIITESGTIIGCSKTALQ